MATALVPILVGVAVLLISTALILLFPRNHFHHTPQSHHTQRLLPDRMVFLTMTIMFMVCCYLMWAFAYLAQLHPFELPEYPPPVAHGKH